tara:strand:+ start:307 stop:756 length:450 start_codon:yes stop_codon:yes gene_type:complete
MIKSNPSHSENFKVFEKNFPCPHCGAVFVMDIAHIKNLQIFREYVGKPLSITKGGGCRCHCYQAAIYTERNKAVYWRSGHILREPKPRGVDDGFINSTDLMRSDAKPFEPHHIEKAKEIFNDVGIGLDDKWIHTQTRGDRLKKSWNYDR